MARALPLDPDVRRAHLLGCARRVFASRGYHAASVADILEEAGVARGTFYNYFESKRAVFQAVLEEMIAEVGHAATPIEVDRPVAPQVRENVEGILGALVELGDGVRILFTDAAGIDAEGISALNVFYGAATLRIETALVTGQQLGMVRAGDAHVMAMCVLGMLREPVMQAALRHEPLDASRFVDEVFAILSGGIIA